jgi:hypothetical protein
MKSEDNKEELYKLLFAFSKENDRLFKENKKLEARIRKAISHLEQHRFNKVNELKKILIGDE